MRCPVCDVDAPVRPGAPIEVTVGTVAVHVDRRPVVACPAGHDQTPGDVVDRAMQTARDTIPQARARWLRRDACTDCRHELSMPVRRTARVVTVEAGADVPVCTLRFDLPSTRCPSCGVDQVPSRSHEDLVVAVPAVFATPSGTGTSHRD